MYAVVKVWAETQPSILDLGKRTYYLESEILYWNIEDIQKAEQLRIDILNDDTYANPQNVQVIQYDPVD